MNKSNSIVVHSAIPLWKHYYAESVEFALQHLEKGDKVFFSYCNKSFPSCPANPYHRKDSCSECIAIQNTIHSDWQGYFLMHLNQ